jgi:hypothetical protein
MLPEGTILGCTWLDTNLCELLIMAQTEYQLQNTRRQRHVRNKMNTQEDETEALEEVSFSPSPFVISTDGSPFSASRSCRGKCSW